MESPESRMFLQECPGLEEKNPSLAKNINGENFKRHDTERIFFRLLKGTFWNIK